MTTVAGLQLLVAVSALVLRSLAPRTNVLIGLAAFSPYLMITAPIAGLLFALARCWPGLVAAVLLAVACTLTQLPRYLASSPIPDSQRIVAMTSNLRLGRANPASVVRAVRDHHVDVLMLEELTADEQARLISAGLDSLLPFHASEPEPSAGGVGIWSRYALTDVQRLTGFTFAFVTARIAVPSVPLAPVVVATHMPGPWPRSAQDWLQDIDRLPDVLCTLAPGASVLVGGDLNATPDIAQFRRLLRDGFQDAAQQAGAGPTRTYPADSWLPPLISIDHVLTRGAVARSAVTVQISGSDHRALVVTVQIPNRPQHRLPAR